MSAFFDHRGNEVDASAEDLVLEIFCKALHVRSLLENDTTPAIASGDLAWSCLWIEVVRAYYAWAYCRLKARVGQSDHLQVADRHIRQLIVDLIDFGTYVKADGVGPDPIRLESAVADYAGHESSEIQDARASEVQSFDDGNFASYAFVLYRQTCKLLSGRQGLPHSEVIWRTLLGSMQSENSRLIPRMRQLANALISQAKAELSQMPPTPPRTPDARTNGSAEPTRIYGQGTGSITGRSQMTQHFTHDGREVRRGSGEDFSGLRSRHLELVEQLLRQESCEEIREWLAFAAEHYDRGDYRDAVWELRWCVNRLPALQPYVFNYQRICERVLTVPLTKEEMNYEWKLRRIRALPRPLKRFLVPSFQLQLRCKYCARYVPYIHPDVPTFGIDPISNSCASCHRMYPMPSWLWDSPEGRAYGYYRMSFLGDDFYEEFERDYQPHPRCAKRRSG